MCIWMYLLKFSLSFFPHINRCHLAATWHVYVNTAWTTTTLERPHYWQLLFEHWCIVYLLRFQMSTTRLKANWSLTFEFEFKVIILRSRVFNIFTMSMAFVVVVVIINLKSVNAKCKKSWFTPIRKNNLKYGTARTCKISRITLRMCTSQVWVSLNRNFFWKQKTFSVFVTLLRNIISINLSTNEILNTRNIVG